MIVPGKLDFRVYFEQWAMETFGGKCEAMKMFMAGVWLLTWQFEWICESVRMAGDVNGSLDKHLRGSCRLRRKHPGWSEDVASRCAPVIRITYMH
jgi:hypothetical protein